MPSDSPKSLPSALLTDQPGSILELTDKSISSALNSSSFLVLDFYYPGCKPCRIMNNTTSELSRELQGQVQFGRLNVRNKETRGSLKEYGISEYPTLLFFNDGVLVKKMEGNTSKSELLAEIKSLFSGVDASNVKLQTALLEPSKVVLVPVPKEVCEKVPKSNKPLLEAFVVSRCPFGLQMQRIMAEMVGDLPDAGDYIGIRYLGSVTNNTIASMHGDAEAQENLRQICIREEQPDRYWDYVSCYMKEGNSSGCLNSSSIDDSNLDACMSESSRGLKYAQEDFSMAERFNITASPTLIMNDAEVRESSFATNTTAGRSPEAVKELLCCGFKEQPAFCSRQLNSTKAVTMFEVKAPASSAAGQQQQLQQQQQPQGKKIPLADLGMKNPDRPMQITDATISSALSQYQPVLVVVGFSETCRFCDLFNATIEELAGELQGQVAFGMVNVQKNKAVKAEYNITRFPTALIFKDGLLAGTVVGNKKKSIVVAKIKQIYPALNTSKVKLEKPAASAPPQPKLTPEQVCVNMTKSDQPLLQAFVVSRCPFGLQMQRIMANIIRESEETDKYLKVMYIGSVDARNNTIVSMHGSAEAEENLRQICIREEEPNRYWDYVSCYMKEGNTSECLKSVQIDTDRLYSCTNESSRGLAYASKDFDLANRFRITGSPTMLMNDEMVKESNFATNTTAGRSPEAVKDLLCCGFKQPPSFCSQAMNESRAATMFSAN